MSEPKKMPPCHVCGSVPCFGICPMVDPYAGDRFAEHCDHEAGAIHDDVRERFSGDGESYDGWEGDREAPPTRVWVGGMAASLPQTVGERRAPRGKRRVE